jgi:hypothetical protein
MRDGFGELNGRNLFQTERKMTLTTTKSVPKRGIPLSHN